MLAADRCFRRLEVRVALAMLTLATPVSAQRQPLQPQSPLAQYPGFGHDRSADEERFRRQELAREQAIARCMQRSGFEYTPAQAVVNPPVSRARQSISDPPHPNARYVASLDSAQRRRYYVALYGVPDPNDEQGLWDPRSPTGGGCSGEAMREVPSVYAALSQLMHQHRAMLRSVARDARVRAAEQRWANCMRARGHEYASPLALHSETDRAAIQGPPPGRTMADALKRNEEARAPARECSSATGLDSTIQAVRIEKETAFVRAHKDVLHRHRDRLRRQALPPR